MSYISSCRVASGEEPPFMVEENGDEAHEAEGGDEDENRDEL